MNSVTYTILKLLKDADSPLSGTQIGSDLGISRSAVWKHISLLREQGYDIESVPRRGHSLHAGPDTPWVKEVTPLLRAESFGKEIVFRDRVDSTNAVAAAMAAEGAAEGTVVAADSQTAGRGRLQRRWVSPNLGNLYFSIILRPPTGPERVSQVGLVAAAALHRALTGECPGLRAGIKWPNDILAGDRKLAGILCEAKSEADIIHYAVVGIGINVNARSFPKELGETATSIRRETGSDCDRPLLLAAVLDAFEEDYRRWLAAPDLSPLLPYLEEHSLLTGKRVVAAGIDRRRSGIVRGLSSTGQLLLETAEEGTTGISSGDVRLLAR
jgi:BirA family biotin operon repressor/biotin-[acetyl-CoA-carboxylase] ligase